MKHILYLILLLTACLFNSCKTEVDDYFESSASQRMENEIP